MRLAPLLWCHVVASVLVYTAADSCGVAEFACRTGECIRLDSYCDGYPNCPDNSDEPPHCTVCNRTYYGRVDEAYSLGVRDVRTPFLCHLTFTAGGGIHGDLVQLAFEEFRVGRYEPGALDGCPDGYMQVAELGRPFTGGSWCGVFEGGAALYYSETATVTVSVRLARGRLGDAFALRLGYRFLARSDAVVRFGDISAPVERGSVAPHTYCTRTYEDCHRKRCKLQSPNYPGMYPRNVSCYWTVRQRSVPTCKHAMVSLKQPHAHKVNIKRSVPLSLASLNKTNIGVRAWRECTGERDRLIVYDGSSTDDPVLLEYCGGDLLPRVTARGTDMLVAFHSSPYSAPLRPPPTARPLRGFELDVEVVFVDSDSLDYAREARHCEFHVKAGAARAENEGNSTRTRRGVVHAPQHTLPPNTTCTWTFHGRPGDLVWIYFSSFTQYSLVESRKIESSERDEEPIKTRNPLRLLPPPTPTPRNSSGPCAVDLRIWDGGGGEGDKPLGRFCDEPPALCARASLANATRWPRPCSPPDGYVSRAPLLALAATTLPGTATHPLQFVLHYEFLDAQLDGEPLQGARAEPVQCARIISTSVNFSSPHNALWFGRGGAKRLRCVYRVEDRSGARTQLKILSAVFGKEPRCITRMDPLTGRPDCYAVVSNPLREELVQEEPDQLFDEEELILREPHLRIYESPWPGYKVLIGCICNNSTAMSSLTWEGGALELVLAAPRLSAKEDHTHVNFKAAVKAAPAPAPPAGHCTYKRRLRPPGAHLQLVYPYSDSRLSACGETPFLLTARGNRSLLVRVWGAEMPAAIAGATAGTDAPPLCHTANRVLVYDALSSRLLKAICPGGANEVHVLSEDWRGRVAGNGAALFVVWAAKEPGEARFSWMEIWRSALPPANATAGCLHVCSSLSACMPTALVCDGIEDCPGGSDEGGSCGAGARILAALRAAGAAGAGAAVAGAVTAVLMILALILLARKRRARDKASVNGKGTRRLTEELLFDSSRASSAMS